MFRAPILFLVFNRPDLTFTVFNRIREIKPKYLYIAADGPRENIKEDQRKCRETRHVANFVDWECDVKILFRESNLGCKLAVSSAIDWFFEHVEEGIILEDDCLPDLAFFNYCQTLLNSYRHDNRVMMISGLNVCEKWYDDLYSYHFSYYGGIWGWASWRRAWAHYDVNIEKWCEPDIKRKLLSFFPREIRESREKLYNALHNNQIDTWDLQWTFAKLLQGGLNVIPSVNLVKNIGFREDGTHIKGSHRWDSLKTYTINFPIIHNTVFISDVEYDKRHLNLRHYETRFFKKVVNAVSQVKSKILG